MGDVIPVIDLDQGRGDARRRRELAEAIVRVGHEVGFFVLVGHGLGLERFREMQDLLGRLFALPPEVKGQIDKRKSPCFRGWEPVGSEKTHGRTDLREQIDLWTEHPPRADAGGPAYLRLLGPNQWLPDAELPGHRAVVDAWTADMAAVADELLRLFSLGLGLGEDHLRARFTGETMSLVKLIHYPPTPDDGAGVNAHHDTGFLTLLASFGAPGLEIETAEGWTPAPFVPGGIVVNLGEMLQAMTGNYLVATPHRVVAKGERWSVGYFHGPALDAPLSPLPLDPAFAEAVAASPRHQGAGFMARAGEIAAGVEDMASPHRAATYGEQLWNYFMRSYPDLARAHHPDVAGAGEPA
jgi:isopenicillin N synthase-like dioxygenase